MKMKRCARAGCGALFCLRYSPRHGFICGKCLTELVELGVETDVEAFMKTPKALPDPEVLRAAEAHFDALFPPGDGAPAG